MHVDISKIDTTQFMIHEHIVNGEILYLVQPQFIGVKWTQANKIFRSSVWNNDGELVSGAFPKFMNWGENPEHFPVPTSLKDAVITEKIDGSLLIVSKYKGQIILRTRGTSDARKLEKNGYELEIFEQTILPVVESMMFCEVAGLDTWRFSVLFEWVSPKQRIILNYGDQPEWYLVGIVDHNDYSIFSQEMLNGYALQHNFRRPPVYTFPTIEDLMSNVEAWKGKEGVVIYSNQGQSLHKVKGFWYLALHRMKEALSSIDKVIDVWYEQGEPSYTNFEAYITGQFDYELWTQIRPEASRICDAAKDVQQIIAGMQKFVDETLKPLPTRKAQAEKVLSSYGKTNRSQFVFKLLDRKPLGDEDRKKLLYQCLKKQSVKFLQKCGRVVV
jgi:hypothetical protein